TPPPPRLAAGLRAGLPPRRTTRLSAGAPWSPAGPPARPAVPPLSSVLRGAPAPPQHATGPVRALGGVRTWARVVTQSRSPPLLPPHETCCSSDRFLVWWFFQQTTRSAYLVTFLVTFCPLLSSQTYP